MLLPWGRRSDVCSIALRYADRHDHDYFDCERILHADPQPDSAHHHGNHHVDSNPDSNVYPHADTNRIPHTIPAPDLHVHAFSNIHAYPNLHADIHPYFHSDRDFHAHTYRHVHSIANSIRHFNAKPYSFPDSMTDIVPFLKSMLTVSGLSAYEGPIARLIEEKWKLLVDEVSTSRLGSFHALKHGTGKKPRPSIMIATHMDTIGLIVTQITDGLLHVDKIGGIDARILPGTPIIVHGKQDLPGVVVMPPMKTLPEDVRDGAIGLPHLLVDVGLLPSKVASLVRVGDLVSFNTQPVELAGETLSGHSLDNRASIAALTICLDELQAKSHVWDVWAVATSQEEETLGGAATSAFHLHPDLAVVVDVTFGKGPGANSWETFPLGKGPTLGWGANLHPFLYGKFKELADKLEIPVAMEIMPASSGTDADTIQIAREGIPTMLLEIPLRYMHTPVEVVAIKDIQRVGRLLAEFISDLTSDFVSSIVWEDEQDEKRKAQSA